MLLIFKVTGGICEEFRVPFSLSSGSMTVSKNVKQVYELIPPTLMPFAGWLGIETPPRPAPVALVT